ncbi:ankyrin repeat and SOCS box protein 16-like [Rhinatrema bivittatum]|uniref:ankyrin repeat and SOCS box protein 16-like n=1 Tax=Rhinatrema bivittatum TaxID=194408 RepID=UPI0011267CD6|nr:ankyrin repeat and SOCS box protein 16-like [Rhinatrema bivittatum]XP_029429953.1 ankyrin repeat and SOCS box protein 16-like [Rhinatrema bivittatum]
MAQETFAFTSSTLRSLRLQREMLELEDRRRALARHYLPRRTSPAPRSSMLVRQPRYCRDPMAHKALYTGDLQCIKDLFKDEVTANLIVETVSEELLWSEELGLWALNPKKKHTSPLRIAANRGYTDCIKHLIMQGANVNATVGGRAALHDTCTSHRTECTQLLLSFGANPNILSEDGSAPLHVCTTPETLQCAQMLLESGASVNLTTRDRRVTPLHVAARHGLEEHVKLYLCNGANLSLRNRAGETALNTACASAEEPEKAGEYYCVVKKLLDCGADVKMAGRKNHTPLHNACGNCHHRIVDLLLQHGAEVNALNCAGYTPLDCILQAVEDYLDWQPERIVLALLNHGAVPVNPKVWKYCSLSPRTLEVLLNSYDRILSCEAWVEAVPPELWQEHRIFYDSALQMTNQPRRLQHLARWALRRYLGGWCHSAVPGLKLPEPLKAYVLLHIEGCIR